MSGSTQSVGTTLTGGIQDISALLPLLGTDQCEQHVGSALDGGYLYAAAAPLSIFGCLGIVKTGISVLISSISIPKISISLRTFSITFPQGRWLGARTLINAGFKPAGTVASLMAMDGDRYKAETRLMQILKEKHIDNPENLTIEWKSRDWNIALVLFTIVAAAMGGTPYIALLLQNSQSSLVHTSWIFPLLRTVGSCLAAVCCQVLIQSRVISLMKNRIIFTVMNRFLTDDPSRKSWVKDHLGDEWKESLPAEQCLWSLKQVLPSQRLDTGPSGPPEKPESHCVIPIELPAFPYDILEELQMLRKKQFNTPGFDHVFTLISWVVLCLSLPATVAGYIGCFTLVSNSKGNGPVIWLGLEAALSIIRILVWALNPKWDEEKLTVKVKLTDVKPFVTTEKDVEVIKSTGDNTLPLVPERRFLEWITPYTGPMEEFKTLENLALYFTLTVNGHKHRCLYMTVFDLNKQIAVTIIQEEDGLKYINATVSCNRIASKMQAILGMSEIDEKHSWRTNDTTLFDGLKKYYNSVTQTLHQTDHKSPMALEWKWSFLSTNFKKNESSKQDLEPTKRDLSYLGRGDEHHRKTELIRMWSEWIVRDLYSMRSDAEFDCPHVLADAASEKAKLELTELDFQLARECTSRELFLVSSSTKIEGVLERRMKECMIDEDRENGGLKKWMLSEFRIGRTKRLEKERRQAKERMEKEMKDASERAEREGRAWRDRKLEAFFPRWDRALELIDEQWLAGIELGHSGLRNTASNELDNLLQDISWGRQEQVKFVKQFRQPFEHWQPRREIEQGEMDATIERISNLKVDSNGEDLGRAYQYPEPDFQGFAKFVELKDFESRWMARAYSATLYDVKDCDKDLILDFIKNRNTRSVINVDPALIDSIPENDHLLYIGTSGKEPAFIQRNRDRWWDQQTGNSSTFYFSPEGMDSTGAGAYSERSTIAHIYIFLKMPSRLRLRLMHRRRNDTSVAIQEKGNKLCHFTTREIPKNDPNQLRLQDFDSDQFFEPGRHELEVVVTSDRRAFYFLRDILIEFLDDSNESNLATKVEHRGTDVGSCATGDTGAEEDRNANALHPAVENDIPS